MGQFEVTPVVYKHLFLTSKRTGKTPVFLGPTMIHHSKDFQTYKVLSSTCVSSCKGLEKAKGYITDGSDALDKAWRTEIPKARHLRCMKHFESNCKQKLNSNLLYHLYITSEVKQYYEALFLSYRPRTTKCSISQYCDTNCYSGRSKHA